MQSFREVNPTTNPYLTQLIGALPPSVETLSFSWSRAIAGQVDVLHLHWPENLLRGRTGPRTAARLALFAILMTRLSLSRTAVVRTLHNRSAHETGGFLERQLLRWCDRKTDFWIRLNPYTPQPTRGPIATIPHGHYRAWFEQYDQGVALKGRLLVFGLIRPYKGIEALLSAFSELEGAETSLHVVGKPITGQLTASIKQQAGVDSRVKLELTYISDRRLAEEVSESELVVLPYREMHNSGAVLLALSLNRPVLVPRNEVTVALQAEVGPGWIRTFLDDLDVGDLVAAQTWVSARQDLAPPDLSLREWTEIGIKHGEVYSSAVALRHKTRRERI